MEKTVVPRVVQVELFGWQTATDHLIGCDLSKEALTKKEVILARADLFNFPQEGLHRM